MPPVPAGPDAVLTGDRSSGMGAHGELASSKTDHFRCFDGLRASAALAVFAFHFLGSPSPTWLRGTTRRWVWQLGPQGVAIFFVISGFLLYRPFVARALAGQPFPSVRGFFQRRSFRIFPGYWIALGGAILLGFSGFHNSRDFVASVFLVQTYRRGSELAGLGVAWTLAIEVAFYVCLPLIAVGLRALGGRGSDVARRLNGQLIGLVALAAFGMAARAWYLWIFRIHLVRRGSWFSPIALPVSIIWYLDCFVCGLLLAIVCVRLDMTGSTWRPLTALARRPWACWLLALGTYALTCSLALGGIGNPPATKVASFWAVPLRGISALLFVLPAVFGDGEQSLIRRFLASRVMASLGTVSFGIYLWHLTIVRVMSRWIRNGSVHNSLLTRFAFIVPTTLVLAYASYLLVERPMIRVGRRLSSGRKVVPGEHLSVDHSPRS